MDENIEKLMSDADRYIDEFKAACDSLVSSKYILADKKIAQILKVIACSRKLYGLFKDSLSGYNRAAEFKKSKSFFKGRQKLVPPKSQTKFIAYVFCLLLELDTKKRILGDFLDEFYFDINPNSEFSKFCAELIIPFKEAVEYVYINGTDYGLDDETVDHTLYDAVHQLIQEMNVILSESSAVDGGVKQDLFLIGSAIENSLTPNKIDIVKALMVGYRNTVFATPLKERLTPYLDKMYKLFVTSEIF